MTVFLWILGSLAVLYLLFLIAVSLLSVYPPRIPAFFSPAQIGLPQETIDFTTKDGVNIRGWWVQGEIPIVVIATHGFFSNRSELAPYALPFAEFGLNVLLIDTRCHGGSSRAKVTFGQNETIDVLAALEYARNRVPGAKFILFGSSMGAVASARAALEQKADVIGLILDGPYWKLDQAAKGFWEIGGFGPISNFMKPTTHFGPLFLPFNPKKVCTEVIFSELKSCPVLFLYGTKDTVVPLDHAKNCVNAVGENGRVVWFEGCGHSVARYADPYRYRQEISDFLKQIIKT